MAIWQPNFRKDNPSTKKLLSHADRDTFEEGETLLLRNSIEEEEEEEDEEELGNLYKWNVLCLSVELGASPNLLKKSTNHIVSTPPLHARASQSRVLQIDID